MPYRLIAEDDAEIDYGGLLYNQSNWSTVAKSTFDTSEIEAHLNREFLAISDLIEDEAVLTTAPADEFEGYSKLRTKSEWLLILKKLGYEMGDDTFRRRRQNDQIIEHPLTKNNPRARLIRLKLVTLPSGYSDDLDPQQTRS